MSLPSGSRVRAQFVAGAIFAWQNVGTATRADWDAWAADLFHQRRMTVASKGAAAISLLSWSQRASTCHRRALCRICAAVRARASLARRRAVAPILFRHCRHIRRRQSRRPRLCIHCLYRCALHDAHANALVLLQTHEPWGHFAHSLILLMLVGATGEEVLRCAFLWRNRQMPVWHAAMFGVGFGGAEVVGKAILLAARPTYSGQRYGRRCRWLCALFFTSR